VNAMVKRTGPTKDRTKQLIGLLQKAARKEKKAIWLDIAERLEKPRRQRASINLWKIEKFARIFKGKQLLVPGKVLGNGMLNEKPTIIALEFSSRAMKKILKAGATALSIEDALKRKVDVKTIMIVK